MRRLALASWVAALALGSGCDCGSGDDAGSRVEKLIGPEGGSISADRITLTIPPGALDREILFFIEWGGSEEPDMPDGGVGTGPYTLGPQGTIFHEPATIEIRYEDDELEGRSPQGLRMAYFAGVAWNCIAESAVDEEDHVVIGSVMHLSHWAIRYNLCSGNGEGQCLGAETCVVGGFCAIPCIEPGNCVADVMMCHPEAQICVRPYCRGGSAADCAGVTGAECSMDQEAVRGVCLPGCDQAGARCGVPERQHICTERTHCVLDVPCPLDEGIDCGELGRELGVEGLQCVHGWCAHEGCDCDVDDGCPCNEEGGGDADADVDADGDGDSDPVAGVWNMRYNCSSDSSGLCENLDGCADFALVKSAGDPTEYTEEDFVAHLDGNVLTFEMTDVDVAEYHEVGTWTFSDDFTTFTQDSCYTYDGVADPESLDCTGLTAGHCNGTGSRDVPGPPAALDQCPEGEPIDPACPERDCSQVEPGSGEFGEPCRDDNDCLDGMPCIDCSCV